MDALRAYLLSDKNIGMLESIIIDKLYETVGISLNRRDPLFKKNMMLVMTTIITDEISNLKTFDNKALMFINNIIIKETVGYIKNLVTQNQELERSSKLSEEGSDVFEKEDYFEELKIDKVEEQPLQLVGTGPKYEETVLIFDQSTNDVDIKNVVSFELVSFSFDFSGYIVDEKNCNFCVDNEPIVVQHGNYTPELLVETLTKLTNLHFTLDSVTEKVTILRPVTKSLTGAIKQKSSNIDFGVKHSINNLLGFENRTYILKNEDLVANNKHSITHPKVVELNVAVDDTKDTHRILTDVAYNYTVHYKPNVSRKISITRTDVKNVNINFDYISNRQYICYIKFNSLIF